MRFAITGGDRGIGVFEAFINAGWEPLKLFTLPLDNRTDYNRAVVAYAHRLGIEVQMSRLQARDLSVLERMQCDVLVVAGYDWRIPPWRTHLPFAINFHPSLLPQARGPNPLIKAILDRHSVWGVTCHRLAHEFDSGEILAQESFPLAPDECLESLDLQTQMATTRLAHYVAMNFETLWKQATPQTGGEYWPKPTAAQRTIDFKLSVTDVLRQVRAFGDLECLACIKDVRVRVRRAVGWVQTHGNRPGAVVYSSGASMVVAAGDGYIGLVDWSPVENLPGTYTEPRPDGTEPVTPAILERAPLRDEIQA